MWEGDQQETFRIYWLHRARERYAAGDIGIETYEREVDDVLHDRVPSGDGWATTYSLDEMRRWAAQQRGDVSQLSDRTVILLAVLGTAIGVVALVAGVAIFIGRLFGLL